MRLSAATSAVWVVYLLASGLAVIEGGSVPHVARAAQPPPREAGGGAPVAGQRRTRRQHRAGHDAWRPAAVRASTAPVRPRPQNLRPQSDVRSGAPAPLRPLGRRRTLPPPPPCRHSAGRRLSASATSISTGGTAVSTAVGEATTASLASGGGTAVSHKDSDSVSWRAGAAHCISARVSALWLGPGSLLGQPASLCGCAPSQSDRHPQTPPPPPRLPARPPFPRSLPLRWPLPRALTPRSTTPTTLATPRHLNHQSPPRRRPAMRTSGSPRPPAPPIPRCVPSHPPPPPPPGAACPSPRAGPNHSSHGRP
jgi:hypothetical protein